MNGDLEFAELVNQYYGSLYRFAYSLTLSEADACDLVQQTFYIWARKGQQLRQRSKVKSWLFTTLHREFLQSRRRSTRFVEVDLSHAETEQTTDFPGESSRYDGRRIARLIRRLEEPFQAPLILFYVEDLSYEEISATLRLPLGTVKSRLSRGVAQLKSLLDRDLDVQKGDDRE